MSAPESDESMHGDAHCDHEAPVTAMVIVPPIPTWPKGDWGDVSLATTLQFEVSRVVIEDGTQERLVLVDRLVTETVAGVAVLLLLLWPLSPE